MATSLKLPPQLKGRGVTVAKAAGKSPHAFMVEAIEQQAAQAERRQRFIADTLAAEKEALDTGQGFDAADRQLPLAQCTPSWDAGIPLLTQVSG